MCRARTAVSESSATTLARARGSRAMSRYGATPSSATDEETRFRECGGLASGSAWRSLRHEGARRRFTSIAPLVVLLIALGGLVSGSVFGEDGALGRLRRHASRHVTVKFTVDIGCIPERVLEQAPVENFFDSEIVEVSVLPRGNQPNRFFGGQSRKSGAIKLTRDGFSMKFTGNVTLHKETEYGFAITNAVGQTIFELGRNRRFPKAGPLADQTCLTRVKAGGATYLNRKVSVDMKLGSDGTYEISKPFAACRESGCEVFEKLVATVGPASGSADNFYAVEEFRARNETWKKYKGHFTMVSTGATGTWGLDSNTGEMKITRNADLNPISSSNWQAVSNNAQHLSKPPDGPAVDFDVGYERVFAVTRTVSTGGGRIWSRRVDGSDDWIIAGTYEYSRLAQVTIGRTHLWGVNGYGSLYSCPAPCGTGASWSYKEYTGQNVKQIEVGDAHAFVVYKNDVTLLRTGADGTGGWHRIYLPSGLTGIDQVAVGVESLWIVDTSGNLHACELPCESGTNIQLVPNAPAGIISLDAGKMIHE